MDTGTKPAALAPPDVQRPAFLQEHYLRTPAVRTGPPQEAVILCMRSMLAILPKRQAHSALSVAKTFEKYEDLQR